MSKLKKLRLVTKARARIMASRAYRCAVGVGGERDATVRVEVASRTRRAHVQAVLRKDAPCTPADAV